MGIPIDDKIDFRTTETKKRANIGSESPTRSDEQNAADHDSDEIQHRRSKSRLSANARAGIIAFGVVGGLALSITLFVMAKTRKNPEEKKPSVAEAGRKQLAQVADSNSGPARKANRQTARKPAEPPEEPKKDAKKGSLRAEPQDEAPPKNTKKEPIVPLPETPQPIESSPMLKMTKEQPVEVPGKLLKEMVSGYETRQVNGFTMLLSTQAIREAKTHNGKPFTALSTEFDGLVKVLPPKTLQTLRKILIWIEWDNIDRGSPNTLAKYYANSIWSLPQDEHPLKANSIEVLSLKQLAAEKARWVKRPRLVLLHELAHAVHHKIVGFDNQDVGFAYKQAMDRRLYDMVKDDFGVVSRAYAATNSREYFAELTCAYLDRCIYYPFARDELKEYDPSGYKVMELTWGKPKAAPKK